MSNSMLVLVITLLMLCGTRAAIAVAIKDRVVWWAVAPLVWFVVVLVGCVAR